MVKIIVEFLSSNAHEKARDWREDLVKAIDEAISNITNEVCGRKVKVFEKKEYSVYLTSEKE